MGISLCRLLTGVKSHGYLLRCRHATRKAMSLRNFGFVCVATRKLHGGANLGLRSVVGRSAGKSPYSGRCEVAATAAKVSQQLKACLEGGSLYPADPSPLYQDRELLPHL